MDEELGQFVNPSRTSAAEAALGSMNTNVTTSSPFVQQEASVSRPTTPTREKKDDLGFSQEQRKALEAEERSRIIVRLSRLNSKPDFPTIQFSYDDPLVVLRRLNKVASAASRQKMAIDFLKRATIFMARLAEFLTTKFPNKFLDLTDYSQHLYLSISQYDSLLADVYDSYQDTFAQASPLFAYITAIGSNAIMYSISRKLVNSPLVSGLANLAKPNAKEKPPQVDKNAEIRKAQIREILRRQMSEEKNNETSSIAPPIVSDDEKLDDNKSTMSFETLNESESVKNVEIRQNIQEESPKRSLENDLNDDEPRKKKIRFEF